MQQKGRFLVAVLGRLGGVLVIAAAVPWMACRSDATTTGVVFPAVFSGNSLECDSDRFLVFGGLRGGTHKDDPRTFTKQAVVLRTRLGDRELDQLPVGPGSLVGFSRPRNGSTVFAVRATWLDDGANGVLMQSQDLTSWTQVEGAPERLISVSFLSDEVGYAWSSNVVYRTEDGGASWTGRKAPGTIYRGDQEPSLDPAGALWVPIGHMPVSALEARTLLRFSAATEPETVRLDPSIRLLAIDASQPGEVWVVAENQDRSTVELGRIVTGESGTQIEHVKSLKPGLLDYLGVSGQNIVVAMSYGKGFLGGDRMMRSRDGGASWHGVRLPGGSMTRYCMTDSGSVWLTSPFNRVYFAE